MNTSITSESAEIWVVTAYLSINILLSTTDPPFTEILILGAFRTCTFQSPVNPESRTSHADRWADDEVTHKASQRGVGT